VGKEKAQAAMAADKDLMAEVRRDVMASKKELPLDIDDDVDEEDFAKDYETA